MPSESTGRPPSRTAKSPDAKSLPAGATSPRKERPDIDSRVFPPRWTFLTNHSHVLILLARDSSMVLREVAVKTGITERAVQRIIAELEQEGYIQKEKLGRQNHYTIVGNKALRHPIEEQRTIGDLLGMIHGEHFGNRP